MNRVSTFVSAFALLLSTSGCGGSSSDSSVPGSSMVLAWDSPTQNDDGSELTDLAGYNIYLGTESGVYTDIRVASRTLTTVSALEPNTTYYVAVSAYDQWGNESSLSNEIVKTTDP